MTHTRSPLRALRAALFAAVCVTLAAVGHSSMSAHSLPPRSLLTAFAVTAALAWTAAGHRRGPLVIASGLMGVQGVLHLIFGAGEHGAPGDPVDRHAEPATAAVSAADRMGSMAHGMSMEHDTALGGAATDALMGSGTGMLAAHLLAALACGLWLAGGEAALFALARTVTATAFTPLRRALAVVRALAPVPPDLRPVRTAPYTRTLRGVVLAHTVSRRGPPRPAAPRATALGARF